jgi:two-component system, OmpR family, sensor histidine kinase VanS
MTHSIRTKLFMILSGFLLFFILLSLGLTHLGLEKIYMWQKKAMLIESIQALDDIYQGNPDEIALELERTANTLGAGIIIFDKNGSIKYRPFGPPIDHSVPDFPPTPDKDHLSSFPLPPPPLPPIIITHETISNHTVLEKQYDQMLKINFMVIQQQLSNGDNLIIRQPLAPVSESASVATQFMLFTGLLSILIGCSWAFFFAKKFTLPILELSQLAQRMAQLDFTQKWTKKRNDEIGLLGKNINHLSDHLDAAITELNQKNEKLMADVERERELDKMRKEFVSNVSHELKTPLSLILGYAEGLKENVANDEENKDYYCSVIMDEAEKMNKLVKDLLNLSQFESGLFQLTKTNFDLSLLLNRIVQKYQNVLTEKNMVLEKKFPENCLVHGDMLRMEQVLLNFLNNAIIHTEFTNTIKLFVKDKGPHFRVFVYNSGRPIPEESLEKIWISFYKIDKARTREQSRYGLGLSIVRAIQELHGNRYGVRNLPQGVLFWCDMDKAVNKNLQ